ncbi:MAG: DUF11 domain-containing protein [Anaerolineae bacterium]|nr:MAG: DUF11 domain-containing protein [Anaerolineae bacterium]
MPLTVVFFLILPLMPLGPSGPSLAASQLLANPPPYGGRLSILPAWIDPDLAADPEASVPADQGAAGAAPRAPQAKETSPTTLLFIQVCHPNPVNQGELLTHTLFINNLGPVTASVLITNPLPANVIFQNWSHPPDSDGGADWHDNSDPNSDGYMQLHTGDFFDVPGDSGLPPFSLAIRRFTVRVTAPITDQASIQSTAFLTANIPSLLQWPCDLVVNAPGFEIGKASHSSVVDAGGTLTYTLYVTNTGHLTATQSFTVTDRLPDGTNYLTSSPPSTYSAASRTVTWTVDGGLGQGQAVTRTLVVSVSSPYTNAVTIANATYRAWSSEVATAASGAPVTVTVRSHSVLTVAKSATPDVVQAGSYLTYTITATNDGNGIATGVVITDVLPRHTHFVTAGGGAFEPASPSAGEVMTWTLGSLLGEGLQTLTATLIVTLETPLTNGLQIPNIAWLASAEGPGDADAVTVTVRSAPILTLSKADSPDPVDAGSTLLYTVTVANDGNGIATGVVITDQVPANTTFASASPGHAGPDANAVITWTLPGSLPPGSSAAVTLSVQVDADLAIGSGLINTAWVTSTQGVGTSGTETTTIAAPDIAVSKWATPAIARPGETITYLIVFTNTGGAAASGVLIGEALPVSVSLVTSQTTAASFVTGSTYAWLSPTVEAGSVGAITVTAQVTTTPGWIDPAGGTRVENGAIVASATPDGDPSNNLASALTTVYAGQPAILTLTAAPTTTSVGGQATITATVTDRWGNPVMNQDEVTVTLHSSLAGSHIAPETMIMTLGQATATITSTTAGVALITGTVGAHPSVSNTAQITFTAGPLHHFAVGPVSDPQTAGVAFTLVITARDRFNNTADFTGTVTIADSTDSIRPPVSSSFLGGADSEAVTITLAQEDVAIVVTNTAGTETGTSNPFDVIAGAPATVTVTADPTPILANGSATSTITVAVADQHGNAVADGTVVTLDYDPTSLGTLSPSRLYTTGGDGWAIFTAGTVPGTVTITATAEGSVGTTWLTLTQATWHYYLPLMVQKYVAP